MTTKPQRPARPADREGTAERDGVTIAYRVYDSAATRGNGGAVGERPTVVFLPSWSIVSSRIWKAQVPYLAKHFRVVTFDGRAAGLSSAPAGAAEYADSEFVADALAILDATGTGTCVLVSLSRGVPWALQVAHELADRALGVVCIGSAAGLVPAQEERIKWSWSARHETTEGWAKYNKHYWTEGGYDDFLHFFFAQMFPEPHSTKQIEDGIGWGREISPERLVDTEGARQDRDPGVPALSCPVLVVHGTDDKIRPLAEGIELADLTGGSLITVAGGGHAPNARDPVLVNRLLKDFVDRVAPQPVRRTWTRALNRPKRVLYLSSPIGLGHARRDLAIARELRVQNPGLEIDWLAQHPVTRVLADAGESVHPASAYLLNESSHIEFEADEHDLHAFQAIRRMDEILVANFLTFSDVVDEQYYDLVVGDEAWDVDYFLHENPELKRFAYAWLTDFVGWLPMPDGGVGEAALTADYNAEMIEQRARFRRLRDRSLFIGDPDDIVDATFGPGLPSIRTWTSENFDFTGYITGFDPLETADRSALRARLGYPLDAKLCLVTVGGSGVGTSLLHRVLEAIPLARRTTPGLEFVVVTGPRIDPSTLPPVPGATIHGYLPNLHHHLAAVDVAITQGGLTTCMELTAARVPFIYVPLQNHFEQTFHVPARLTRHNAGHLLPYPACTPTALSDTLAKLLTEEVAYLPLPTTATQTAATLLTDLL